MKGRTILTYESSAQGGVRLRTVDELPPQTMSTVRLETATWVDTGETSVITLILPEPAGLDVTKTRTPGGPSTWSVLVNFAASNRGMKR